MSAAGDIFTVDTPANREERAVLWAAFREHKLQPAQHERPTDGGVTEKQTEVAQEFTYLGNNVQYENSHMTGKIRFWNLKNMLKGADRSTRD